ncbi:hypothetical protein SteCoe_12544 [Stentor coeruleus]|uniref:Protein kinase domain-containing protein n=1 Tax=Stentor coeruleus TaxID=5963 RepID=A0A1R2CAK9_9CILI|nr:hypothetical protein SteCoe_12544 [Stentor coeruleus]
MKMICCNCRKEHNLSKLRTCLGCNRKFCKECGTDDPLSLEKLSMSCWCWGCYINREQMNQAPKRSELRINRELAEMPQLISGNPFQKYEKVEYIAKGGTSRVYKIKDKIQGDFFALKEIIADQSRDLAIRREFLFSSTQTSDNIVKALEIYKEFNCYYVIYELMDLRLSDLLQKQTKDLHKDIICHIAKEVLKGIEYCHYINVMHRDLKTENIYLSKNGDVKIGDFGEMQELTEEYDQRNTVVGSLQSIPPEMWQRKDYDFQCDIWSFGVILFEIIERRTPFPNRTVLDTMQNVINGELPILSHKRDEGLKRLYLACMERNPGMRPTAKRLLNMRCMFEAKNERKSLMKKISKK